jgi:hypothetical protein
VAKKWERRPLRHPEPYTQEEKEETKQATLGTGMDNRSKDEKRITYLLTYVALQPIFG